LYFFLLENNKEFTMRKLFLAVVCLAFAGQSQATPLSPGGSVVPGSTGYSGVVLADTGLLPFSFAGNIGSVREIVLQGDPNNVNGASALDFIYQATVTSGNVGRVTGANYGSFLTGVSMAAGSSPLLAGSVSATSANRSSDGNVIGFNFVPEFSSGTTLALIVRTDAINYTKGTIGVIDGGGQTLNGYAPTPEPGSIVVLGGLILGGFWCRRRIIARRLE
jgi:hypothetical protein